MNLRDDHLPLSEMAPRLGLHPASLYSQAIAQKLPLVREDGQWWLPTSVLVEHLEKKARRIDEICDGMRARMRAAHHHDEAIEREVALCRIALDRGTTIGVYE